MKRVPFSFPQRQITRVASGSVAPRERNKGRFRMRLALFDSKPARSLAGTKGQVPDLAFSYSKQST